MLRRNRGDYARALVFIAHEAADACAHPAFRAPSSRGHGMRGVQARPRLKEQGGWRVFVFA
jgi:hypothetical protein